MATAASHPAEHPVAALGALGWAHFLNDGYINYLPAVLPALLVLRHIPLSLVGSLILAVQGLGSLLQPLFGALADHLGGRRFVIAGLAVSAICASAVGLIGSYPLLIATLMLAGVGSAIFHPQALAQARAVGRGKGSHMSLFLIGGELGRGVWPSVAALIVSALGLPSLWLLAIPGLLTLPLLAARTPSLTPRSAAQAGALRVPWALVSALVGFVGLRGLVTFGVATFVPLFWHQLGGSLIGGASLISVMLGVGVIGNFSGGILADRFGRRRVLLAASSLSTLFLALFLVSGGFWWWVVLALLGISTFATAPITMLMGQDLFPGRHSMASGISLGSGTFLGALGVFVMGLLSARFGVAASLTWLTVFSLLAIPLIAALPKDARSGPAR